MRDEMLRPARVTPPAVFVGIIRDFDALAVSTWRGPGKTPKRIVGAVHTSQRGAVPYRFDQRLPFGTEDVPHARKGVGDIVERQLDQAASPAEPAPSLGVSCEPVQNAAHRIDAVRWFAGASVLVAFTRIAYQSHGTA